MYPNTYNNIGGVKLCIHSAPNWWNNIFLVAKTDQQMKGFEQEENKIIWKLSAPNFSLEVLSRNYILEMAKNNSQII
jgi:hypothetical protein